jgi:hypothetical protein
MADGIAAGGPRAAAALDRTMDKLRGLEDPAKRAQIVVGLFGTQSEEMGAALFTMDLSTAVTQLGNVEGAAKTAIGALGDNTAGTLATARRNIEVASDGIKGALATAFAPQIEGFATFVTSNLEAVMKFLLDMANGGIDAGRALAGAAASGIEGFGLMVGYVGPAMMSMIGGMLTGFVAVATAMDPTGILGIRDAARGALGDFQKFRVGAETGFAAVASGSKTTGGAMPVGPSQACYCLALPTRGIVPEPTLRVWEPFPSCPQNCGQPDALKRGSARPRESEAGPLSREPQPSPAPIPAAAVSSR